MSKFKFAAVAVAGAVLAGCAGSPDPMGPGPRENTGTLLGALGGAAIGSQFGGGTGGHIAGALIGAGIGGLVGNRIGAALDDEDKQLGRHHALDVYRLLAMLTEPEEQLVRRLHHEHRDNTAVKRAAEIVTEIFADVTKLGVLRMREHALADDNMQVEPALELLHDLFQKVHGR